MKISTKSVHDAESLDDATGAVSTPIYQSSTFGFARAGEVSKAVHGESGKYVYSRWDNPTVVRLEKKLASLEMADDAAFFSSGMAAISTGILSFVRAGDHVVSVRDLYGETHRLIHDILPGFGVDTTLVDTTDIAQMERAVTKHTRVLYIESPTNPTLKVVDIERAAKLAHQANALLLVDSTFASPINQRPLELGADVVLHSATKYLNGHSDVLAGAAAGSKKNVATIKLMRRTLGGSLDPHAAWLVLRGMKTMALRVKAQNENAQLLAEYLSKHPKVKVVNYPGLKKHPQHTLAKKQMSGFGGMMSFELKGSVQDAMRLTEKLKLGYLAASLGGLETLISQPATLSQHQVSADDKAKIGIPDTLIRLSVGVEDIEDLIDDFDQALASV
jgi:cystathionine beta-lyase/cystathionine gamma-synthase